MSRSIAALATAKSTPMVAALVADIPQGVLESMMTKKDGEMMKKMDEMLKMKMMSW